MSWENRDLRQPLRHRHRMVQARTRVLNRLQAVALNEGLRCKKRLWRASGRQQLLESYGWEVLGIEAVRRFDDSRNYDDDILEIVDQARTNPDACIIGTVFSYKPE